MKDFTELRKLNVNEYIEKKNGLSYLSWAYAVDTLLQADPTATWEFLPYLEINETIIVRCQVHAFEKTMFMQLAVFDYKNKAIKNPDACQVSNSMMRCLVKCIATFGIGLYIYAGEDLPEENDITSMTIISGDKFNPNYICEIGTKFYGKTIEQIGEKNLIEMRNHILSSPSIQKTGKIEEFLIETEKYLKK